MATVDEIKIIVQAEVDDAIRRMNELNNAARNNSKSFGDLAKDIAGLSTGYDLAVQAGQAAIRVVSDMVATSVKLAAAQERVKMEFSVLTGSMEKSNALFAKMNSLASQTPLELADITAAGKQLLSVGVSVDDITEKLRMLGDVAMGDPEKLDRLTQAFAQLKSKGTASMEQLNRFIEAGVPIMKELEKQTGKSGEELFKFVSAGKVGFADVETALKSLTSEGNLMHDMMLKVSETTEGKFSSAMDAIHLKMANLGNNTLPIINTMLDFVNKKFGDLNAEDDITTALKNKTGNWAELLATAQKMRSERSLAFSPLERMGMGTGNLALQAIILAGKADIIKLDKQIEELKSLAWKDGPSEAAARAKIEAAQKELEAREAAKKAEADALAAIVQAEQESAARVQYMLDKRYSAWDAYFKADPSRGDSIGSMQAKMVIAAIEAENKARSDEIKKALQENAGDDDMSGWNKWNATGFSKPQLSALYDPENDPQYQDLLKAIAKQKEAAIVANEIASAQMLMSDAIGKGLVSSVSALGEALASGDDAWHSWMAAGQNAISGILEKWGEGQILMGLGNIMTNPGLAAYQIGSGIVATMGGGALGHYASDQAAAAKERKTGSTYYINQTNVEGSVVTEKQLSGLVAAKIYADDRGY